MESIQTLISGNQYIAIACVLAVMVVGDLVSKWTQGKVPSGVAIMLLLIAGFWSGILPTDLATAAGLGGKMYVLAVALLVTHLGTLISRKQMIEQWKTVVICFIGLFFLCLVTVGVGSFIFGKANAVSAAPVLAGGAVAAAIMQEAANAVGNSQAALVALVAMNMQGLVGMPIEAAAVRKQVQELHQKYVAGELTAATTGEASEGAKKENKDNTNMILFKLVLCVIVAYYLQVLTAGNLSIYVACLLVGFVASELGFLPDSALTKANSDGFLMFVLLGTLFCGFSAVTPELIAPVFISVLGLLALATVGLVIAALISAKVFSKDETFFSSMGIVVNCFLGFPLNVMIGNEALNSIEDPEEKKVLTGIVIPKLLVAGFICVTIVSVVIAGVMKSWL